MFKIYCDMDGVLTNFDLAYRKLGRGEHIKGEYTPDFYKNLSEAGEDFWTYMEWMPDGKKLWEFIKHYDPDILSAPTDDPTSKSGKIKWIGRELGGHVKYILEKDKYNPWVEQGGMPIFHTSASNTIRLLRDLLE